MNIALIGFGDMGRQVKSVAEARGHKIVSIIDPEAERATARSITAESLGGVDVALDFSHPSSILANIDAVLAAKVNLLVGTTGWYGDLDSVRVKVEKAEGGFLWSPNFSVGVNLYLKILERAAEFLNNYEEYDVWGRELHHRGKADSPSGTAKIIEKILLDKISRKTAVVEDRLDRKISSHEIHFSSTRGGSVNFAHEVGFDSAADAITISHVARDRSGYALGAVKAAEWLKGKKGFFGMEDFLARE